jgi:hypothetical protein
MGLWVHHNLQFHRTRITPLTQIMLHTFISTYTITVLPHKTALTLDHHALILVQATYTPDYIFFLPS